MKRNHIKSAKGFTLVEMLGVLAIIAILVSIVSVGVMSAIRSARITSTVANLKNYETAVAAHIAFNEGNGIIPITKGIAAGSDTLAGVDEEEAHVGQVLIASGAFEALPSWRVGEEPRLDPTHTSAVWNVNGGTRGAFEVPVAGATLIDWSLRIRAECVVAAAAPAPGAGATIDETDATATFDIPVPPVANSKLVYVKIPSVTVADAVKLSEALNRHQHTATAANPVQTRGRFVFSNDPDWVDGSPEAEPGTVNCYYYICSL